MNQNKIDNFLEFQKNVARCINASRNLLFIQVSSYGYYGMSIISERGEPYTKDTCIAKHFYRMITEEEHREELEELLLGCESPKARLLWEIFFETEVQDIELLENRIFQYGTTIKAEDYLGRELFVGMVSLLNQLKSKQTNQED